MSSSHYVFFFSKYDENPSPWKSGRTPIGTCQVEAADHHAPSRDMLGTFPNHLGFEEDKSPLFFLFFHYRPDPCRCFKSLGG